MPIQSDPDLIRALDIVGTIRHLSDEEINEHREKELKRLVNNGQVPVEDIIGTLVYRSKLREIGNQKNRLN